MPTLMLHRKVEQTPKHFHWSYRIAFVVLDILDDYTRRWDLSPGNQNSIT
jgi:hypothetical protein